MSSVKVGILGFQGCIEPHQKLLSKLGVTAHLVRSSSDLADITHLILPGGESTTMLRCIERSNMFHSLLQFGKSNAVWGICAGAILLAREVTHPQQTSLRLMDIKATRNFYGSQRESFNTTLSINRLKNHAMNSFFIRAPLLEPLTRSEGAAPLLIESTFEQQPVFFSQGRVWASSFHVELGDDPALHQAFLSV